MWIAAQHAKAPLTPYSFERREPGGHDATVDIKYSGICHSDIHKVNKGWGGSTFPMVPGHEIAGIVSQVGTKVTRYKLGDRVAVDNFIDSCRKCDPCRQRLEQYCLKGAGWTYDAVEADGKTPTYGGYSNKIVLDENYILRIPNNLPLDRSAPLLCTGIALYPPLVHWRVGAGKNVAIVGLGGLGHIGVKIAHALGADVTVLSRSLEKEEDCKVSCADNFYSTSDSSTSKKLRGYFDVIINTVSVVLDFNKYMKLLGLDGTTVLVELPEGAISVGPFSLTSACHSIAGSAFWGIRETQEMLDFCSRHNVACDVEVIPIQE